MEATSFLVRVGSKVGESQKDIAHSVLKRPNTHFKSDVFYLKSPFLLLMMIDVSCAIIIENGLILATQRSLTMALPLKWEFPGGKVEPNETPEEALIREIKEELDISIEIISELSANIHTYGSKTIRLIPFTCRITGGSIVLKEHIAFKWLNITELLTLDWAEADVAIVESLVR